MSLPLRIEQAGMDFDPSDPLPDLELHIDTDDSLAVVGGMLGLSGVRTVSGGGATYVSGFAVRNTTPATALATDQYGPILSSEGTSWDTDGQSRTLRAGWALRGQSSPTPAVNLDLLIDSGTGSGWVSANIVLGSGRVAIGATPATSGVVRLEHGASIRYRNNADDNNLNLVSVGTVNSSNDVTVVGNNSAKTLVRGIPQVHATQTNAQTINNTTAAVTFDGTDDYDSDAMHDPSSTPERLVIKTAGRYAVKATVKMNNNAVMRIVLRLNGTTELAHDVPYNIANYHAAGGVSIDRSFAVNDYLEVMVTTTTNVATSPGQCHFSAAWIGDTG